MNLGRPPLQYVRDAVRCSACGEPLRASCAGSEVEARYVGPDLTEVRVLGSRGKVLHQCGGTHPDATEADTD